MKKFSIEKIVEDKIEEISSKNIIVDFKDMVYIYKTISEFRRYFHNSDHYKSLDQVHKFVGNKNRGAFYLVDQLYSKILPKIFDENEIDEVEEIEEKFPKLIPNYY